MIEDAIPKALNASEGVLARTQDYLASAGLREYAILAGAIAGAALVLVLGFVVVSKLGSDWRYRLLYLVLGSAFFLIALLAFWWLQLHHWQPLLDLLA